MANKRKSEKQQMLEHFAGRRQQMGEEGWDAIHNGVRDYNEHEASVAQDAAPTAVKP